MHGGPLFKVKAAAETINNDNTITADDTLVFAAAASTSYLCTWTLGVASDGSTGFQVSVTAPAAATIAMFVWSSSDNSGANARGNANNTGNAVETDVGSNYQGVVVRAYVVNSTNTGNISLLWAQRSAAASDTTVIKHSMLEYQVVA